MASALCQLCGKAYNHWEIRQAEFHVGRIENWKLQLCQQCQEEAEKAVRGALQPPTWPAGGPS